MKEYRRLSHAQWDRKRRPMFIPTRGKRRLYGALRRQLAELFHVLASRRESIIVDGYVTPDYICMRIGIPPKYVV